MRANRYRDVMLTVIAVCLSALTLSQFDPPEAEAGVGRVLQEDQERSEAIRTGPHAPTSTLPLRYRIPWARHRTISGAGNPDCVTVVSVVNFGPATRAVHVEFFDQVGASQGVATLGLDPGEPDVFCTDDDVIRVPFICDAVAGTGGFDGYAHVNAEDPRIVVTAMMRCGDQNALLPLTINSIPAYPVGATAEFFQAGMPATWTPPMAEVPE